MIRPLRETDLPWLREHQNEYAWELGPDFAGALVYADADDKPVMVVGGWRRVEVHCITDGTVTAEQFCKMHAVVAAGMKAQGFGEAITFFDTVEPFARWLTRLGWQTIHKVVMGRRL